MLPRPPWLGAIQCALAVAFYAGLVVGLTLGTLR
jgi:hypothetical protein